MNIEELNDKILEDLAGQHRTYFVTGLVSEQIGRASLEEVVLYAYGVIAAGDEAECVRENRAVRDHEGHWDCEVSPHFWRGVFDRRGTMRLYTNRQPCKKSNKREYEYPHFGVRGTQLLLGRLYDFFLNYSAYPDVASERFLEQIDSGRGRVELTGMPAQKAIYCLYHGAHVGEHINLASDIFHWRPERVGWRIDDGPWSYQPRSPDMSKLRPIPAGVFDAK